MEKRKKTAYESPVLNITDVSLELGIATTSVRFDEGDNVIQEQGWEDYDKGNYDIEFY